MTIFGWDTTIWNLRVQTNLNIEKIAFKLVQMKFLPMHITNQKFNFDIFTVGNLQNIFMEHDLYLKRPYYGLWKVHILVLGVPNNRLTCMQGQKTLSLSYNMHLFLPYLLNDSQMIRTTIHFSKPLLCVTLICGDWSIGLIFISSCL